MLFLQLPTADDEDRRFLQPDDITRPHPFYLLFPLYDSLYRLEKHDKYVFA